MNEFSALLPRAIESLVQEAARAAVAEQQQSLLHHFAKLEQQQKETLSMLGHVLRQERGCGVGNQLGAVVRDLSDRIADARQQSRAGFEDLRALTKVYSDRLEAKLKPEQVTTRPVSDIRSEKLLAYLETEYALGYSPDEVVLKIGKHSSQLAELFTSYQVKCGAFITAYNAQGEQQSDRANAIAHAELLRQIVEGGHAFIEGVGTGMLGDWPAERSVFVYGMDKATACTLGRELRQDAIVWVGADAVPQLMLLR